MGCNAVEERGDHDLPVPITPSTAADKLKSGTQFDMMAVIPVVIRLTQDCSKRPGGAVELAAHHYAERAAAPGPGDTVMLERRA